MLNNFRYHAGLTEIPFYTFRLTGSDVEQFLHVQTTYDVKSLKPKNFHLVSLLDPQGRVETYGWLLNNAPEYLFLAPKELKDATHARLEKFLISEDVIISEPQLETWQIVVGARAFDHDGFKGEMFADSAVIGKGLSAPGMDSDSLETWRGLTGWPSFDGADFKNELINNLRLFDLTVTMNKGCYPGQETVSKIATRRGAAYSPVLIEMNVKAPVGDVVNFEKRIGVATHHYEWEGKHYLAASLLRDFRVEKMELSFSINNENFTGIVRYYPLLAGSNTAKALELYYEASDYFKVDKYQEAEEKFRRAIELDPNFADAYESLGVMLGRFERFQEAIDLMDKLSSVDPKSVLAHTNKSLYFMRLGKIEEAEEEKSKATLKSFQKFGDEAKTKELENQEKQKKESEWAQRESMFLQVLEIDAEDSLANYGLGSIAVERGEWEKARMHLEKVIHADPNYSVAYLALGKALKALGSSDEAKNIFKQGISVAAKKGDLMPANQMQSELERL